MKTNSRVSVSRTLSVRGPKPRRLLQAIPDRCHSTGDWNRTNELLVQGEVQRPTTATPAFHFQKSTPSGNRTRPASFKGSRRDDAPERVIRSEECPAGVEPAYLSWKSTGTDRHGCWPVGLPLGQGHIRCGSLKGKCETKQAISHLSLHPSNFAKLRRKDSNLHSSP